MMTNEIKKKTIRLRDVENNDLKIFISSLHKYRDQNYSKHYIPVFQNVSENRLKCCTGYKIESESFDFISTEKNVLKNTCFHRNYQQRLFKMFECQLWEGSTLWRYLLGDIL